MFPWGILEVIYVLRHRLSFVECKEKAKKCQGESLEEIISSDTRGSHSSHKESPSKTNDGKEKITSAARYSRKSCPFPEYSDPSLLDSFHLPIPQHERGTVDDSPNSFSPEREPQMLPCEKCSTMLSDPRVL